MSEGHDVPPEKIVARYYRCLDNLYDVIVIEYICLTILNQNQSFHIIILRKYVMVNVVFIQILFLIGFFNMFMINYLEKQTNDLLKYRNRT